MDLTIWNYSPKVQYERLWDDITTQCRGLVTNSEGKIIARPFRKFFNMEELDNGDIPNETFEVFDKMDGSLGIAFKYEGEFILCTRGSFTSQQSIKGLEIARKYNLHDVVVEGVTYLFEILYPENRIVVGYGDVERLVLLGIIVTETGEEIPYGEMVEDGWDIVKKYDAIEEYTVLKSIVGDDEEGFVIRFKNGFRMKIKGDEYVRLHRILTNISNRDIWEYLKDDKPLDEILEKVPDEFYNWVKETKESLLLQFDTIEKEYKWIYKIINRAEGVENRAVFASYAKKYKHPSILFKMLDGGNYKEIIWRLIFPDYSKPFKII